MRSKNIEQQGPRMTETCRLSVEFNILARGGCNRFDLRDAQSKQDSLALHRLSLVGQHRNTLNGRSPLTKCSTVSGEGLEARHPTESIKEGPLSVGVAQTHLLGLAMHGDERG